jgi:hypothetical protein
MSTIPKNLVLQFDASDSCNNWICCTRRPRPDSEVFIREDGSVSLLNRQAGSREINIAQSITNLDLSIQNYTKIKGLDYTSFREAVANALKIDFESARSTPLTLSMIDRVNDVFTFILEDDRASLED